MPQLSAIVITRDEAANIGACLDSLAFCAERIVVDSGSTDATVEIAQQKGARVEFHAWRGYGPQKNYALSLATGDWVLSIDADERVSPELAAAIKSVLADRKRRRLGISAPFQLLRAADAAFRLVSRLCAAALSPRPSELRGRRRA